MDKMFELINALNDLTKAIGALTEKVTSKYLDTFETIYDPAVDDPQAEEAPKEQPTPETKFKIMALEEEIKETQAEYDALLADMDKRIQAVDDSDDRDLLTKRYLEFKTWNAIAAEFGYSVQHIYRLHTKAVEKLRVDESS